MMARAFVRLFAAAGAACALAVTMPAAGATPQPVSKLDATLSAATAGGGDSLAARALLKRIEVGQAEPLVQTIVRFEGDISAVKAHGAIVRSVMGDIATVDIPESRLAAVAALPNIVSIEASRPLRLRLDASVPATRADTLRVGAPPSWTGGTGSNVIVGVIDSGIDFLHRDFRNGDGTTRILAIWDQRATGAAGSPPAGYSYGGECTPAMINAAIAGDTAACTQKDTDSHGTHVAGIAMAGNPYARLVNARLEFGYKLLPDPCPSLELAQKNAKNMKAYVDFFRKNGVQVVNMSWGGTAKSVEAELELCNIGKTPAERKKIAREYFDIQKKALQSAIGSAPQVLFVAAAGNSNADAAFEEAIPADIVLPNLLTVGAVDKAGDEAPFTSYGPTVKAHANGYQVESYLPGGDRVAFSGTSMASPQVTGLAAKMLAVNPKLKPTEVIAIILKTVDKTADGRRFLVHPAKALEAAKAGGK